MALPPDSSRPIQWGILGAGDIAATVGADIARSPDSEVAAVGARDTRSGGRGWPASWAPDAAYGSYRELVEDADSTSSTLRRRTPSTTSKRCSRWARESRSWSRRRSR